jgi:TRAP transporter 4TM/12TM fusion protein
MGAKGIMPVARAAEALLVAMIVAWVAKLPEALSLPLYTEQFMAAALGLCLLLAFLLVPGAKRAEGMVPWVDIALGVVGLATCWYIALRYPTLVTSIVYRPWDGVAVGAIVVLLVGEATRRTAGLTLLAVILALCAYAYFGYLLSGAFATRQVDLSRLAVYLGIDTNAILGAPLKIALIVVTPFVLMGRILSAAGGGDYFTELSTSLMGRRRGGAAKIAVFGSALFGMISGSAVANVAGVGVITIPLMKRSGFPPQIAASIEAVGSTGGQLMPPVMGAAAFLIAEYLQVPYSAVVIAATVPAFLYYAALFIQVDLEAAKRGISGVDRAGLPSPLVTLARGWIFPIPFAVLIYGLLWLGMEAEYAALIAAGILLVLAMVFGYNGKRLSPREALRAIVSTGGAIVDLLIITAAAGLVIGVLNLTGLAFGLTDQLLALAGDHVFILLLMSALVAGILGMGMPTVGVYIIMATLAAPALVKFGLLPMQAHLFVMYFGMLSMLTPPVALAAFAAANIAKTDPWKTGWTAVRVGWSAYLIPFLFALSPSLLLEGTPAVVAFSVLTAVLGILFGSVAMVGYFFAPVAAPFRAAYLALGLALLIPPDMFSGALVMNMVALVPAFAALAYEKARGRAWQKSARLAPAVNID